MKYFTLIFATFINKEEKKSILMADSEEGCIALFHSEMGKLMKDDTCITALVEARNTSGGTYKSEFYARKEPVDYAM